MALVAIVLAVAALAAVGGSQTAAPVAGVSPVAPAATAAPPSPAGSSPGPSPGSSPGLPAGLELTGGSALLVDAASGQVLAEKNAHEPLPPASLTKVMTLALVYDAVASGQLALDDVVNAGAGVAELGGSQIWLEPGERMSVGDLLLAVAIASANDASLALAEHLAGTEAKFVVLMNERAREQGMRDGSFKNAHGLDEPGHLLSAWDVAAISRYALRFPDLLQATSTWEHYLRGGKSWLVNTNRLLRLYPGVDGLKTGSTDKAGFCVAATAVREQTRLIAVVMNAPTSEARFSEAARLLNYGFANFATLPLVQRGQVLDEVRVQKGRALTVPLAASADLGITVARGAKPEVEQRIVITATPVAPIAKGQHVGQLVVYADGREAARVDLLAERDVPRLSFWEQLLRVLGSLGRP
jgi:D-alanyl-D-alanine carboxypeptidase (penicillin-binding protein 5/6)